MASREITDKYFSSYFKYKEGILHCESVPVTNIKSWLEKCGITTSSPVFVYSKTQIVENVEAYQNALQKLGRPTMLNYAMKANMNPTLMSIMKDQGCSVTLVSGLELKLAIQLGFKPENLLLNGNGKQNWEIELAVRNDCMLNIDSLFNLKQTINVARNLKTRARVLLRVNPDIDPKVHEYICTGSKETKFGINEEDLDKILADIKEEPLIHLIGLHCHIGSTITDINVFRESAIVIYNFYKRLKADGYKHLNVINLGGGLGINYKQHAAKTSRPDFSHVDTDHVTCIPSPAEVISVIDDVFGDDNVSLILEPGRSLIGNSGILVCTVLGVKHGHSQNYIVVDGAMTEVIRPALYDAYHHIDLAEPSNHRNKDVYNIVGPVCESGDFLGKDRYLSTPHEGCSLVVFDVGAYCSSMGSNYNMRVHPAEVLINGRNIDVIRRPDTLDDILTPYTPVNTL
ncbi:hypothetical protein ACF0H5_002232 [Mactra antiquata]